jgi:hypothetical protein
MWWGGEGDRVNEGLLDYLELGLRFLGLLVWDCWSGIEVY